MSLESPTTLLRQLSDAVGNEQRAPIRQALRALGPSASPALLNALSDPDDFARWEAINLLGELALASNAKRVVQFALSEDEVHARWRAFWAVTRHPRNETTPLLLRALRSARWERRWRAALILSMLGLQEAGPIILEGLRSDDPWVAWEAVSAAKGLRLKEAQPFLENIVSGSSPDGLRREAVLALGAVGGPDAVRPLAIALRDGDSEVRWRASMALARIGSSEARQELLGRLRTEPDESVLDQIRKDLIRLEGKHDSAHR